MSHFTFGEDQLHCFRQKMMKISNLATSPYVSHINLILPMIIPFRIDYLCWLVCTTTFCKCMCSNILAVSFDSCDKFWHWRSDFCIHFLYSLLQLCKLPAFSELLTQYAERGYRFSSCYFSVLLGILCDKILCTCYLWWYITFTCMNFWNLSDNDVMLFLENDVILFLPHYVTLVGNSINSDLVSSLAVAYCDLFSWSCDWVS